MTRFRNLFGEPVALWAGIQAFAAIANSFGWLEFAGIHGQTDMAVVMVALNAAAALHMALFTHHTLLAPVVELLKALIGLGAIYGLHVSTEQTATIVALITALAAGWHRTQTSPLAKGNLTLAA